MDMERYEALGNRCHVLKELLDVLTSAMNDLSEEYQWLSQHEPGIALEYGVYATLATVQTARNAAQQDYRALKATLDAESDRRVKAIKRGDNPEESDHYLGLGEM